MKSKFLSLIVILAFSFNLNAKIIKAQPKSQEKVEESSFDEALKANALKQTQETLTDPKKVNDIISKDPAAQIVHKNSKDIAGSDENVREMYAISADILPVLMEMNQDNPDKALESLSAYSKDPAKFLKSLPANIRERIEKLGKKVEAEKGKASSKP